LNEIHGSYDTGLVVLSFVIAIVTSYTAVDIAARIHANRNKARRLWLSGGAVAMGTGVWCMHYVGMLAFRLPIGVQYHIPTVVVSLAAAILASAAAFYVVSRTNTGPLQIGLGSCVMGSGIAAMHYIGMAAMRLNAMHMYNRPIWAGSVALAIVISYVGLFLLVRMRDDHHSFRSKSAVGIILGLAIPIMHYTGMASVHFVAMPPLASSRYTIDISTVAIAGVVAVTATILGITLLTSIIDRRLLVQHSMMESERQILRALIDHIPDSMYVKDTAGRFALVNKYFADSMGIDDPQALIGKTYADIYPARLAEELDRGRALVISIGKGCVDAEETRMDAAGKEHPVHTTRIPLRNAAGQITGIACVARDISERLRAEEALRDAERKYRSILEEALFGIFEAGPDGHLLLVNPAMATYLGYASPEEMMRLLPGPLWEIAARPESHDALMARVQEDGHVRGFELEVHRHDGSTIWISASVRARVRNGELSGFVGMFEDVTERKLLRDQLLQAQKLESVGQLAAGIAHEINTPIQYIGDNVRFLQDSFSDLANVFTPYAELLREATTAAPELPALERATSARDAVDTDFLFGEIPHAIEQTLEGVSRVAALVSAMKEFSHPGTGEKVLTDLNRAIENSVTVARNEWKYVADVRLELDEHLPSVSCLPGEFNQVVLNLVVNAAHAIGDANSSGTSGKGLITIRTRDLPSSVEIQVQDTGTGIPEKARDRVFDPFFTTKEIGKGTGQGLAIARSVIVDKHQGSIGFETEGGVGTTFFISLPKSLAAVETEAVAA
jgi:PAS domain S-box-containing protein